MRRSYSITTMRPPRLQPLRELREHGTGRAREVEHVREQHTVECDAVECLDRAERVHVASERGDLRVPATCIGGGGGGAAELGERALVRVDCDHGAGGAEQLGEGAGERAGAGTNVDPGAVKRAGGREERDRVRVCHDGR